MVVRVRFPLRVQKKPLIIKGFFVLLELNVESFVVFLGSALLKVKINRFEK